MTLSKQQRQATIIEFQENLSLSNCSIAAIATDLHTTPEKINNILLLSVSSFEEPWILKNYLEEKIFEQKQQPYPFTALTGDYHDYWFLNTKQIEQGKIG